MSINLQQSFTYGCPTSEIVLEDDSAVCTSNDVSKVDSLSSVNVKDAIIVLPNKCGKRRKSRRNLQKPSRHRAVVQALNFTEDRTMCLPEDDVPKRLIVLKDFLRAF